MGPRIVGSVRRAPILAEVRFCCAWGCLLAFLAPVVEVDNASAASLKDRFFQEGPVGWAALKSASQGITASGTHIIEYPEIVGSAPKHERWEIVTKGDLVRAVRIRAAEAGFIKHATVVGPRFSFVLQTDAEATASSPQPDETGDWAIKYMGPDRKGIDLVVSNGVGRYVQAPWTVINKSLVDLVVDPAFVLEEISWLGEEDHSLVKADFEYKNPHPALDKDSWDDMLNGTTLTGGSIVLDPRRYWAIQSASLRTSVPARPIITVEYGETKEGEIPLLKRVLTKWVPSDGPDDTAEGESLSFEFDSYKQKTVPDEQFTLAAFGVDSNRTWTEGGPPPARDAASRWYIGSGLLALFLAGVWMLFRYRDSRSEKK